jgi:tRNA A37 methylthiotransferase MiaB
MYKLNEQEQVKADDFIKNHKCIPDALWEKKFEYIYSNCGIGEGCSVRCLFCYDIVDVTDVSKW